MIEKYSFLGEGCRTQIRNQISVLAPGFFIYKNVLNRPKIKKMSILTPAHSIFELPI